MTTQLLIAILTGLAAFLCLLIAVLLVTCGAEANHEHEAVLAKINAQDARLARLGVRR